MIQVQQISKSFGDRVLFHQQSFHILDQERVGLIGRNGHGKSTFMKILIQEIQADEGKILLSKNFRLGYLKQHLQFSQTSILEEARLGLPEEDRESTYKIEKCLQGLGFQSTQWMMPPHELSGGYHLRLELAKVILSDPDCLLLDEPTNYLDVGAMKWLIRFLQQWKKSSLIISHDRSFIDQTCTHILGIHRGQFKKIQGQTDKYYECLLEEEELYEKTQLNQEKKIKKMEAFIERFKAKASKAKQAQSRLKALNKMTVLEKLEDLEEWDFSFPYHPCPGKVLLQAQQISFGFGHHQNPHHPTDWIIRQFSITCYQKDRIGIIGRNGKGKSTLLRLLAGEYQPQEGRLTTHPQLQTSYFGQTNIKNFDPEQTVLEEIQNTRPDLPIKTLRAVCGHVLFSGDEALKKMKVLSGGEQSRVMLGKMLLTPSSLLFLDEPSHHLDMESIEKLTQALEDFPGAVILVSHDEELLKRVCHRLYLFIHDDIIEYPRSYESFEEEGGWDEWEKKSSAPAALPLEKKEKHSYELQKRKQQELQKFKKMLIQLEQHIQQTESTLQTLDHQIAHHDPEKLSADISWSSYGQQRQDLMDQLEKSYQEWENLSKKIEECT